MRLTSQFETTLRRYVLGELEEGLRAELEELLITDTEAFEALGVIEDELIEEYLEGTGSAAQRQTFEQNFLTSPERSRHVRLARGLKERAALQERTQAPARFVAKGRLFPVSGWQRVPTGLAATLAVSLIGNAWLASRVVQMEPAMSLPGPTPSVRPEAGTVRVAESTPPLATVAAASPSQLESSRPARALRAPARAPERPPDAVHTFALTAGLLRSGGSLPRLTVPVDAVVVRLVLELTGGDDYSLYRAALHDADGDEIWTASKLKAEPGKASIAVEVPVSLLPRGDYRLKLSGLTEGAPEALGTYAFRVNAL